MWSLLITWNIKLLHFQDSNDKTSYLRGKFLGKVKKFLFFVLIDALDSRFWRWRSSGNHRKILSCRWKYLVLSICVIFPLERVKPVVCASESPREGERKPFVRWIAWVMSRNCGLHQQQWLRKGFLMNATCQCGALHHHHHQQHHHHHQHFMLVGWCHPNQILSTTKISTDVAHHQDYILSPSPSQKYVYACTTAISISRTAATIMVAPYQWAAISPCQAPEQVLTDILTAQPMLDHARCDIAW